MSTSREERSPTEIDAIANTHLDALTELDPVSATFAGISGHDHEVTDYSPAGHQARADGCRRTLKSLSSAPVRDGVDRVTAAALRERLGLEIEAYEAGLGLTDLNTIASPVQHLREVFDVAPTSSPQDWHAVAQRLDGIGEALAGYRESLRAGLDSGWRPPARQVNAVTQQCRQASDSDGTFASLARTARMADEQSLPDEILQHLDEAAEQAASAFAMQADWLDEQLAPLSRPDDAIGREKYPLYARAFLGTAIDLDDTYAWGLDELTRIESRMVEVARLIVTDGTATELDAVDEAIAALDADPAHRIVGAEEFRDWMQSVADTAIAELGRHHFDIPEPLRTLRCRLASSHSGAIYYTTPSEDFSRPGQMWWAVPKEVTEFSTWRDTSTVHHEGVPGHHLQIGHAVYLRDVLNRWRRLGSWVSGHGEGWALYAERLMDELGYLDDLGDLMGMLDAQALRAARVVVDIGVHCAMPAPEEVGGGLWDADKAWAFLRRHTRVPEPVLRFELDRYLGWPGQAISYKVGERVWLELRAERRAQLGKQFDLRGFHQEALDLGSVGLDVLRGAVLGTLPRLA